MERSGLRSHLSGSVPISIAVHLIAVLLFLIIPLTANVELPDLASHLPDYMRVAPMPPPPPVARVTPPSAPTPKAPVTSDTAAPTIAPDAIHPEPAPPNVPDLGTPRGAAVPEGLGTVTVGPPVIVLPPDPPRSNAPVRVADLPVTPVKIADARPVYPEIARVAHLDGTVILEAVLDTTGRVTQLRVLKSAPMFDQAALDAVRQWRYTPSLYGGHPVSVLMTITVRFQLQ
jgi:protein TonB